MGDFPPSIYNETLRPRSFIASWHVKGDLCECTFAEVDTIGPNSFTMANAMSQSGILIPISSVDALRILGTTGFFGSIKVRGQGINSLTSFITLSSTYANSSIMAMS